MQWVLIYLKGIAMGAADVVPGVSGGTIAFITGIYERLIQAIRSANIGWFKTLLRGDIKACWQQVDGTFLVVLFAGIATSILTLAKLISWLLLAHPLLVWSFFFGLIIASIIYILRSVKQPSAFIWVLVATGAAIAVFIGMARPADVEVSNTYLFLCGAIAICAMILPGISGSFILVLLGAYSFVLAAVGNLELVTLGVFIAGCVIGLLVFSHVLGWLLANYHDPVLGLLTGFLAGSLYLIWPWKQVLETYTSSSGKVKPLVQENISPLAYNDLTGQDPQLLWCVLLAIAGIALVLGLEKLAGAPDDH